MNEAAAAAQAFGEVAQEVVAAAMEALAPEGTAVALVESLATKEAFMHVSLRRNVPEHWKYRSIEQLVLSEGQAFSVEDVRYVEGIDGTPKNCFEDALLLAREHSDEGWSYAEGYAIGGAGIDVHHAWCVDDDGKVVDPTWQAVAKEHDGGVFPAERAAYVGVVMTPDAATRWVLKTGTYGVLDWQNIEALLEKGLDAIPTPWDED